MSVDQETLVFRREGVSPSLSLLIPTFAFPNAPEHLTVRLQGDWNAPLPIGNNCLAAIVQFHVFGGRLDTRLLSTPELSTSELLRTL